MVSFLQKKENGGAHHKNKQIKLAALTVAVAAGVMAQPVKARAEEAPETEAASETESTSAQEQEAEAAAPAQSNESIVDENETVAVTTTGRTSRTSLLPAVPNGATLWTTPLHSTSSIRTGRCFPIWMSSLTQRRT